MIQIHWFNQRVCYLLTSLLLVACFFPRDEVHGSGDGAQKRNAQADSRSHQCKCNCPSHAHTVYVPMTVTERRIVPVTAYRTEVVERTVTVRQSIPEIRQVRDVYVEMVPHVETQREKYQVHIPEWHTVMKEVTVEVPTRELRTTTRQICRQVQVEELRTITRDNGHWEEVNEDTVCKVWKPDIVTEQVPVIVCRDEVVEEPYEYYVTVYHPETRSQAVKICKPVVQEREREVQVSVCVPKKREAIRSVSTFRIVEVPQVQRCTVQVPYTVQKEVDVQVCRLVPRQVCTHCGGATE